MGPAGSGRHARPPRDAAVLLSVALGGGLGSLARYGMAAALPPGSGFPWSTFFVNTVGCLLIGAVVVLSTERWRPLSLARPFLGAGVLGGFTTYSTVMLELRTLGARGQWALAEVYGAGTLVTGLLCVWAGVAVTRRLVR